MIYFLGVLAALSLFGYALVNLIRMPDISPDAFVPKELSQFPAVSGPANRDVLA